MNYSPRISFSTGNVLDMKEICTYKVEELERHALGKCYHYLKCMQMHIPTYCLKMFDKVYGTFWRPSNWYVKLSSNLKILLTKYNVLNKTTPLQKHEAPNTYVGSVLYKIECSKEIIFSTESGLYVCQFLLYLPFQGCTGVSPQVLCPLRHARQWGFSKSKQLNWIYSIAKRGLKYRCQAFSLLVLPKKKSLL